MKNLLVILLIIFFGIINVYAEMNILPKNLADKTTSLNDHYLIYFPENYKQSKKRVPLIIYLHGGGRKGLGKDVEKLKTRNLIRYFQKNKKYTPVLVIPQALKNDKKGIKGTWNASDLNILLNHVKSSVKKIDYKRIYLTGASMGGMGTWMWASSNPEHFAAIMPLCGGLSPGGGPKHIVDDIDQWQKNLVSVPVWAFHSEGDPIVSSDRTKDMIDSLNKLGAKNAKKTIYPGKKHGISFTYEDASVWDWLFSFTNQR